MFLTQHSFLGNKQFTELVKCFAFLIKESPVFHDILYSQDLLIEIGKFIWLLANLPCPYFPKNSSGNNRNTYAVSTIIQLSIITMKRDRHLKNNFSKYMDPEKCYILTFIKI